MDCKQCAQTITPHLRDATGLCQTCDHWLNIARPTRIDDRWGAYHWSKIEQKVLFLGVVPERFRDTIKIYEIGEY